MLRQGTQEGEQILRQLGDQGESELLRSVLNALNLKYFCQGHHVA